MKAPKRWIETQSGSSELERALLLPALHVEVPAGMEERIWAGLAAAAPLIATGASAAQAAQAATATKVPLAVIAKAFAIGAASGALLTGGLSAIDRAAPAEPQPAPGLASPATTHTPTKRLSPTLAATPGAASAEAKSKEPPALHFPAASAPGRQQPSEARPTVSAQPGPPQPASAAPGSRLKEEAATLRRARAALRRGDLSGAFAALEVARSEFGHGALGEEREALTIELLARSGQRAAAGARAAAFLKSFPNSPHAAHVRSFQF